MLYEVITYNNNLHIYITPRGDILNNDNILEMKSITKTFPGVKALDNVNIYVKRA